METTSRKSHGGLRATTTVVTASLVLCAAAALLSAVASSSCTSLDGVAGGDPTNNPDGSSTNEGGGGPFSPDSGSTSGDGGSSDGAASNTPEMLCASYGTAICARLTACRPGEIQQTFGGPLVCADRAKDACLVSVGAKGSHTAATLGDCIKDLANLSCQDLANDVYPSSCVSKGDFADGTVCIDNGQCLGLKCGQRDTNGCGKCQTPSLEGGPCDPACAPGLVCSGGGKCEKVGQVDQPCGSIPCSRDLRCVGGSCKPYAQLNEFCQPGECDSAKGIACTGPDGTCVKQPSVMNGGSCMGFTVSPICTGGLCGPSGPASPNPMCFAFSKLGEPCGSGPPPKVCMNPFQCVAGQCLLASMTLCQ